MDSWSPINKICRATQNEVGWLKAGVNYYVPSLKKYDIELVTFLIFGLSWRLLREGRQPVKMPDPEMCRPKRNSTRKCSGQRSPT